MFQIGNQSLMRRVVVCSSVRRSVWAKNSAQSQLFVVLQCLGVTYKMKGSKIIAPGGS